jgi:excisionase family DNA binding protein
MGDEPMVTAKVIAEKFEIPRSTLYRMVDDGRIPAHDVTKSWHKRRQFQFRESEVRKAIEDLAPTPPHQP